MKCFIRLFACFHEKIQLLLKVILHLATISAASGVLFLLGFYVIPVFAESIPHVVSQNKTVSTSQRASDQDGDGLSDSLEQKIGSEIMLKDTDGDGVPDGLEVNLKKKSLITTKMVVPIF